MLTRDHWEFHIVKCNLASRELDFVQSVKEKRPSCVGNLVYYIAKLHTVSVCSARGLQLLTLLSNAGTIFSPPRL
jgi:hypothetical protein